MEEKSRGDELYRVLALEGRARVLGARTSGLVEELRRIHEPTPAATAALGRLATGALLLAATLEKVTHREPVLTVEVEGNGPLGRIVATASPAGWVRAFTRHPGANAPAREDGKLNVSGVVGSQGSFSVVRDVGYGQPYRGTVPLVSGELAKDLAHYLNESEQTPSAVVLGVFVSGEGRVTQAGGYLVQLLPGVSDEEAAELTERVRELGEVTRRLRSGAGPLEWFNSLFPEGFDIIERYPVEFRCGCSIDRVERALKLLGRKEVTELLEQALKKPVGVTCEFCRRAYSLDYQALAGLLLELDSDKPHSTA